MTFLLDTNVISELRRPERHLRNDPRRLREHLHVRLVRARRRRKGEERRRREAHQLAEELLLENGAAAAPEAEPSSVEHASAN